MRWTIIFVLPILTAGRAPSGEEATPPGEKSVEKPREPVSLFDGKSLEGWKVIGGSDVVLSRGRVVVEGDQWQGETGGGRFVKRERSAYLK